MSIGTDLLNWNGALCCFYSFNSTKIPIVRFQHLFLLITCTSRKYVQNRLYIIFIYLTQMCKLHIANCESELYKMHITKNNSPVNTNPHIPRFCNNFIHQSVFTNIHCILMHIVNRHILNDIFWSGISVIILCWSIVGISY